MHAPIIEKRNQIIEETQKQGISMNILAILWSGICCDIVKYKLLHFIPPSTKQEA